MAASISSLGLSLTSRCNLRCGHCLVPCPQDGPDLPLDLVPRLLEDAKRLGVFHVSLTGGEPGLHPRFDEIMDLVGQSGLKWTVVTNSWNPGLYERAIQKHYSTIDSFTTSLDGPTAAVHDSLRGRAGSPLRSPTTPSSTGSTGSRC